MDHSTLQLLIWTAVAFAISIPIDVAVAKYWQRKACKLREAHYAERARHYREA